MAWLARLLMLVPAIVAGWFVSREDPRFWVVAMVIALVFLALTCVAAIYAPSILGRRNTGASDDRRRAP
ncbi:hypothetical protein [Bradyrhizobium sp. LHD-71]|jgi:predicted PurR-regulated permease PerM|uniref:hypothetical protein n=1 Tax=Bradyrhizobium sp. LHD-71 TaxID=3072141 RepID=UPI00280FF395|nr:hypothetical protein [Bradyrhizobium sp. LHD-71]MDQ8730637.1 hypothetical protein [Bradyrhizobium sp. LHD-71]